MIPCRYVTVGVVPVIQIFVTKQHSYISIYSTSNVKESVPIRSKMSACSLRKVIAVISRALFVHYVTFQQEVARMSCDNGCLVRLN